MDKQLVGLIASFIGFCIISGPCIIALLKKKKSKAIELIKDNKEKMDKKKSKRLFQKKKFKLIKGGKHKSAGYIDSIWDEIKDL